MNEFQQEIYKTIDILTEEKLKQLGFDKTKRGKVISVDSTACVVEIDGDNYTCKIRKGIYIQPNDIVFVKFPQNNNVDKYVDTVLGGNEIPEYLVISAEEILAKLKTVDGEGSGLDADMLDGKHGNEFATKEDIEGISIDGDTIVQNINTSTSIIDDKNLSANVNDKYTKIETDTKLNTKVDKIAGKQLSTEDYTTDMKNKLINIEDGAEKNKVNSVNSKTGDVVIDKTDISLGNVENKSSATIRNEITKTNVTNALGYTPENSSNKGVANGYAPLDSNIKIPLSMLPDIAKQQTYVVETITDRDNLTGLIMGEKCYITTLGDSYIWDGIEWVTLAKADWENINLQWVNIVGKPQSNVADIDDATSKRHTHSNKSIIDTITQTLTDRWNSAWNHISDAIRHITSTERNKWNTVDNKADTNYVDTELNKKSNKGHIHTETDISDLDKYTKAETDAKLNLKQDKLGYTPLKEIPIASPTLLGGIKVGNNLTIAEDGTLSALSGDEKSTFIIKQELFVSTEGQTLFNLTKGHYQPNTNTISVYLYGGKQPNISFNEISTSALEFTEPLKAGTVVLVEYIELSSATPYPIHGSDHLTGGYDPIPKATTSSDGLMAKEDKAKLNTIEQGANKYIHPKTHSLDMITETADKKILTASERSKIAEIDNKVDKVGGKGLSDENYTLTEKNKLAGIATGATKNDTDANLKNRANHTGTQPSSTISDFASTVRNTVLTGLSTATNAAITVTDTVLSALGKLQKQISDNLATLTNHIGNKNNPHGTTKSHVGLGNVDNTSDLDKPISTAAQTALNNKSDKGHIHDDRYYTETEIDNKLNEKIDNSGNSIISGTKTFSDTLKVTGIENFDDIYIKRTLGSGSVGTTYINLSDEIKNGGYHRFWKISFPTGASFWGKIKITLYGGYSSFNASGSMAKEINVNFNTGSIYSNVGCYTELSGYVEKDFRISEAIWNVETSQWEFWIYSHQLQGNNVPYILMECWAKSTSYINYFNQITFNPIPTFLQDTTYQNVKGNAAGQTLVKSWSDLPTYQNPYGETIASVSDLPTKLSQLTKDIDFDERYYTESEMNTKLNDKVNNSRVLTDVPINAKFTDTIYTHPSNHPASMITESATKRFVSDTEKNSWNSKAEISDIPTKVGQLQNDKNYVTQSELGEAGLGDMTKGVYDTNNNGKVDIAEVAETVVGNEIQLGGRFKIAYNDIEDSLDIEVI